MWHDIEVAAQARNGAEIRTEMVSADLDAQLASVCSAVRGQAEIDIRISGNVDDDHTVELGPDRLAAIADAGVGVVFVARTNQSSDEQDLAAELGWI